MAAFGELTHGPAAARGACLHLLRHPPAQVIRLRRGGLLQPPVPEGTLARRAQVGVRRAGGCRGAHGRAAAERRWQRRARALLRRLPRSLTHWRASGFVVTTGKTEAPSAGQHTLPSAGPGQLSLCYQAAGLPAAHQQLCCRRCPGPIDLHSARARRRPLSLSPPPPPPPPPLRNVC